MQIEEGCLLLRESEAFSLWNDALGKTLGDIRRILKVDYGKAGDGIFATGKLKGKSVDHVGPEIGKPYKIDEVIKSVKNHYMKDGVDFIMIDGRALSAEHKSQIKEFMNECLDACDIERTLTIGL